MKEVTLRIKDRKARVLLAAQTQKAYLFLGGVAEVWIPKKAVSLDVGHLASWFVRQMTNLDYDLFEHPITDDNRRSVAMNHLSRWQKKSQSYVRKKKRELEKQQAKGL